MGWRDRDYAKWTDEERSRFLGSSMRTDTLPPAQTSSPPTQTRGGLIRPGAGIAILVSGVLFGLGHFPTSHPIFSSLHFQLPGLSATPSLQSTGTISGPRSAALGSTLTLNGTAPPGNGLVTIEGSYDGGQTWQTLSSVESTNGAYTAQISLNERGTLEIRTLFADGSQDVGSITVA